MQALNFTEKGVRGRTKHVDVKLLKLKELFENDEMEFLYVASEDNTADLFTKNLKLNLFVKHVSKIFT